MSAAHYDDDVASTSMDAFGNEHTLFIPTPLSAYDPTKDSSLDEMIAEIIFEVFQDDGDGSSVSRTAEV